MHFEGETIIVRPLREEELPTLLKIYSGTPLYFDAIGVAANSLTLSDVQQQWQAVQQNPQRHLFGIEVPAVDLLIGVADVELDAPDAHIATLHLLLIWGGFQRQGYGQEVLGLLEEWLVEQCGIRELYVIAANNDEGRRFWEWRGYHIGAPARTPFRNAQGFWMRLA